MKIDLKTLLDGKAGLRLIPDVHGRTDALDAVLADADRRHLAVASLGDWIDRGPDSPGAVRRLLDRGVPLVVGNHDNKFARWAAGNKVKIGDDLAETIRQFEAEPDGARLIDRYVAAVRAAPHWMVAGANVFVHAAFDLRMLSRTAPSMDDRRGAPRALAQIALYGETRGETDAAGRLVRTYRWIDQIPEGLTVWIGHDVLSTEGPVVRTSARGGRLVNLDAGVDRGGPLAYHDFTPEELMTEIDHRTLDQAPPAPLLTILVGPSGSGKSSWAAANADPDSVISSDGIRQEIYGDFREQGDREEVMRIMAARARDRLAHGLPVVVDATHISRRDRLNSVALVPPHHPVRYVLIDRPLEDKLRDAGWRAEVVLGDGGETLVEVHHERALSALQLAAEGDGLPNVVVEDLRVRDRTAA